MSECGKMWMSARVTAKPFCLEMVFSSKSGSVWSLLTTFNVWNKHSVSHQFSPVCVFALPAVMHDKWHDLVWHQVKSSYLFCELNTPHFRDRSIFNKGWKRSTLTKAVDHTEWAVSSACSPDPYKAILQSFVVIHAIQLYSYRKSFNWDSHKWY